MKKMKELVAVLNEASKKYYEEDSEILSNQEYDVLYDQLLALEKQTSTILANSPTQTVGYTVLNNLIKIKHDRPMLSLDKTKETSKLKSFLGEKKGILSWKLDGLTIVLKYKDGELVQAITRGNGEIGEDITHNAKVFANFPLQIPYKGELFIRGEGVISNSQFEKINEGLELEQKYKNPRNLCSGTVRQLNSEIVAKRGVQFFAFDLVNKEETETDSKMENLSWLKSLGFQVVDYKEVTRENIEEQVHIFKGQISHNDIGSDGLVLTFDDIKYSQSLGVTSKFPKDSIAFKWADEMAQTKLLNVEWNTSRTGMMNPIAIFEPVDLEGTEVSRASVHNVSILRGLKLGLGDEIKVYKANMIIPQIAENLTGSDSLEIPKHCFVCHGETEIRKAKEGEALYCTNPDCSAKRIQRLSHFVSRDAMNIEGLSEETLRKLLEKGVIKEFCDIFKLEAYKEEIQSMEGFGEKSYTNLVASIERAKDIELPNFIFALGIDQVGLRNAKLLCKQVNYDMEEIKNISKITLEQIDGFGEVIAENIVGYFSNENHKLVIDEVVGHLRITKPIVLEIETNLVQGLNFVVTGEVEIFKNRKELSELIEAMGGKVVASVTKKTNYLINNDLDSPSSKNKKAKELDIPILNEQTFIETFHLFDKE